MYRVSIHECGFFIVVVKAKMLADFEWCRYLNRRVVERAYVRIAEVVRLLKHRFGREALFRLWKVGERASARVNE